MDKSDERLRLLQVFGKHVEKVAEEFERPDFIVKHGLEYPLGIEVTSIYSSNADAKLRKLPEYSRSLLDRTGTVHRVDKSLLTVDEMTLMDKDGNFKGRMMGIVQELPKYAQRVENLFQKISEKETKLATFQAHCHSYDLIVHDASNLFHHQDEEGFYSLFHRFFPRRNIIESSFREIYLITLSAENKPIYVPLLANIFTADCFAIEHLLKSDAASGRPASEIFQLLSGCLWELGYRKVLVSTSAEGIGFHCGAWEMLYHEGGKNIRDWMVPPVTYQGTSLPDAVSDLSNSFWSEVKDLVEEREKLFSAVSVRFPAHEA